jgi:drug/metabolite transporter (DMT)-like permease
MRSGKARVVDLAVICGLASALSYGAGDFFSQAAARALGLWRSSFYLYLFAFAVVSIWLVAQLGVGSVPHGSKAAWAACVISGMVLLGGAVLFTQGLIRGSLAVVAPVTASYGAISTVLAVLAGEPLTRQTLIGLALTILGACIVAIPRPSSTDEHPAHMGLGWAIGAAFAYGVGFWLQGTYAVPVLGPMVPVWAACVTGFTVLGLLGIAARQSFAWPNRAALTPVVASSVFSVGGYVSLAVGLATRRTAIVIVLSSLTSAVTVLLARSLSDARLALHQWIAIGMLIAGLAIAHSGGA